MCQPVKCDTCGKTTWSGCGRHVEQVRLAVPAGEWCPGHNKQRRRSGVLSRVLAGALKGRA
jgi:hypothetical protein